jgi:hypothetical protein
MPAAPVRLNVVGTGGVPKLNVPLTGMRVAVPLFETVVASIIHRAAHGDVKISLQLARELLVTKTCVPSGVAATSGRFVVLVPAPPRITVPNSVLVPVSITDTVLLPWFATKANTRPLFVPLGTATIAIPPGWLS